MTAVVFRFLLFGGAAAVQKTMHRATSAHSVAQQMTPTLTAPGMNNMTASARTSVDGFDVISRIFAGDSVSPARRRRLRSSARIEIGSGHINATSAYPEGPHCESSISGMDCAKFSSGCLLDNHVGIPCHECDDSACLDSGCQGAVMTAAIFDGVGVCFPLEAFGFGPVDGTFDDDYQMFECTQCESNVGCTSCENGVLFQSEFPMADGGTQDVSFCTATCPPSMGELPGQWKISQIYKSEYYAEVDGVCKPRDDLSQLLSECDSEEQDYQD